jgi:uncharacterized protein with HEPN domain
MDRDLAPVLHDILLAIERVEIVTTGKTLADFSADWKTSYIVQRAIEIISEAARRIPASVQAGRPEIPWRQVMGIGNVLRHEYQGLSDAIIWGVVVDEIPKLKLAIESIARTGNDSGNFNKGEWR